MKRNKIIIVTLGIILILIIVMVVHPFSSLKGDGNKTEQQQASGEDNDISKSYGNDNSNIVFPVTATIVKKGNLVTWVNTSGYAYPIQDYEIKPNINGEVTSLSSFNGEKVKKGELLFKLDDTQYQLEVNRTRDELIKEQIDYNFQLTSPFAGNIDVSKYKLKFDSLKTVYEKSNKLYDKHKISLEDFDRIKRDYETLKTITSVKREDVIASMSG